MEVKFIIDHQGSIIQIEADQEAILPESSTIYLFKDYFSDPFAANKLLTDLKEELCIIERTFHFTNSPDPNFYFSGLILYELFWIVGTTDHQDKETIITKILRFVKTSILPKPTNPIDDHLRTEPETGINHYNEISILNNELVNLQREMSAKIAEIEQLNFQQKILNMDLEHFVSIITHDIREPLRIIYGYLKLLDQNDNNCQRQSQEHDYIHLAIEGTNLINKMVENLLVYAKTCQNIGVPTLVDCNQVMQIVIKTLQSQIDQKKVSVHVDNLPVLNGAFYELVVLFSNLIENAIKFSKPDSPNYINITCQDEGAFYTFKVSDTGIGINQLALKRGFDIFGNVNHNNEFSEPGIGLAICKKIVNVHHGKIWVKSQEGVGSDFYFTIAKNLVNFYYKNKPQYTQDV